MRCMVIMYQHQVELKMYHISNDCFLNYYNITDDHI